MDPLDALALYNWRRIEDCMLLLCWLPVRVVA